MILETSEDEDDDWQERELICPFATPKVQKTETRRTESKRFETSSTIDSSSRDTINSETASDGCKGVTTTRILLNKPIAPQATERRSEVPACHQGLESTPPPQAAFLKPKKNKLITPVLKKSSVKLPDVFRRTPSHHFVPILPRKESQAAPVCNLDTTKKSNLAAVYSTNDLGARGLLRTSKNHQNLTNSLPNLYLRETKQQPVSSCTGLERYQWQSTQARQVRQRLQF